MALRNVLLGAAALVAGAAAANAQVSPTPAGVTAPSSAYALLPSSEKRSLKLRPAPWYAPIASIVPGAGQAILHQQRSLGYVVAETFLLIGAVRASREANSARNEYRRLASEVARASFGTNRPRALWKYYETLESTEYPSSGEYDLNLGGKFTPETDLTTYNGRQWLQARETFWASPTVVPPETSAEYQKAIAFYQAGAYSGSFRWSWRDHSLEQAAYIQAIKDANRSEQRFVSATGLVIANSLVSVIDAYINVRVRRYGGAGLWAITLKTKIESVTAMPGEGYIGTVSASIAIPRR
jgi:hypothetical protein